MTLAIAAFVGFIVGWGSNDFGNSLEDKQKIEFCDSGEFFYNKGKFYKCREFNLKVKK